MKPAAKSGSVDLGRHGYLPNARSLGRDERNLRRLERAICGAERDLQFRLGNESAAMKVGRTPNRPGVPTATSEDLAASAPEPTAEQLLALDRSILTSDAFVARVTGCVARARVAGGIDPADGLKQLDAIRWALGCLGFDRQTEIASEPTLR